MGPPPTSSSDTDNIEQERRQFEAKLATAINEEDDPLAVYHQFVQWTVNNYGENNPNSGLLELLERATQEFKEDPPYKTDLRYLKLWSLYARQVERSSALSIYAYLLANEIGTSYSVLYEQCANLLEAGGKHMDAEAIYQKGIKRQARPLERLKNRYREFQTRTTSLSTPPSPHNPITGSTKTMIDTDNPRRNHAIQTRTASGFSSSTTPSSSNIVSLNSTPESRYALMLAPPAPDKRPEKQRFNFSLLFTEEGVEYSIQEARARSIGLLGKKWAPLPTPEVSGSSSSSVSSSMPVEFNDDGQKSIRNMGQRRSLMHGGGAEPTVTINTKEALADVFGMYNSPEKTATLKGMPGSKHAPLKKVEPITPIVAAKHSHNQSQENENAHQNAKKPTLAFRPYVDENAQPNRTAPGLAKLAPFVDPGSNKTPLASQLALSVKDPAAISTPNPRLNENPPRNALKLKSTPEDNHAGNVFSKVFTPAQTRPLSLAPLRDVFTDDHGKPQPKQKTVHTHERAKSHHDILSSQSDENVHVPAFKPFVDENARTPFKVFSRPPEHSENANGFTPKTPGTRFVPLTDQKPAFTPFREVSVAFPAFVDEKPASTRDVQEPPEGSASHCSNTVIEVEDDAEEGQDTDQYQDDFQYEDEDPVQQNDAPLSPAYSQEEYQEDEYQEVPLGGRFGQFNVMTPITERTFEVTTSTRGGTPSERFYQLEQDKRSPRGIVFTPQHHDEHGAVVAAERLAAELREKGDSYDEESPKQLRFPVHQVPSRDDLTVVHLEEKTGALSLVDTLTLNSKFKPPNPCNPFDPSIMSTLLSRLPADPHHHDLRDQESKILESLQKFAKKARKTSSNSNNTGVLNMTSFPLTLHGDRFNVLEKLGEGGFGAVFKARDLGARRDNEASDDDFDDEDDIDNDEDEGGSSMIAMKVVKPRNLWEYHALRRVHSILPGYLRRSVIIPHALYAFHDESFLILDFCPQGTLLNTVNNAVAAGVSQQGACLDELLVMFFAIELLRLLEALHNAGFIHGDLKIDNCLLRLEKVPGGVSAWSSLYQPSGECGWSYKGIKLIDFGRTIDTRLFSSDQQYVAEWPTDDRDCFEVREDRPFTYQTDYFGMAGIIYCMLFGKYIQSNSISSMPTEKGLRYKVCTPMKRYWQTDLWNRLFDLFLNPCLVRPDRHLPVCDELEGLRSEMETWLQANCNRTSNTLKGLLKKVEVSLYR